MGKGLQPEVIILRIGERPGLGRAVSLRASMASHPHAGDTDADHRMVTPLCAGSDADLRAGAAYLLTLAQPMRRYQVGGAPL